MNGVLRQFIVTILAGWVQHRHQHVIEYLAEETRFCANSPVRNVCVLPTINDVNVSLKS